MGKKLRMKHVDTDDVGKQEQETNTEAIYDDEQREEILDEDEITASELPSWKAGNKSPKREKVKSRRLATMTPCRLNLQKTNTKKTDPKTRTFYWS